MFHELRKIRGSKENSLFEADYVDEIWNYFNLFCILWLWFDCRNFFNLTKEDYIFNKYWWSIGKENYKNSNLENFSEFIRKLFTTFYHMSRLSFCDLMWSGQPTNFTWITKKKHPKNISFQAQNFKKKNVESLRVEGRMFICVKNNMRHDDRYSMVSGICTRDGSAWDHKCEEKS